MRHGKGNLDSKRPRYHPVIAWEQNNLTNDFVDISRVALDDRYGKVGAPLSKRRNGVGPTDGKTTGLFGSFIDSTWYQGSLLHRSRSDWRSLCTSGLLVE